MSFFFFLRKKKSDLEVLVSVPSIGVSFQKTSNGDAPVNSHQAEEGKEHALSVSHPLVPELTKVLS